MSKTDAVKKLKLVHNDCFEKNDLENAILEFEKELSKVYLSMACILDEFPDSKKKNRY